MLLSNTQQRAFSARDFAHSETGEAGRIFDNMPYILTVREAFPEQP